MNTTTPIRLVIADDLSVARMLLQEIFSDIPEVHVVGTACNGQEAVAMVDKLKPHVVVMDLVMPELDGIEATKIVRRRHPHLPIIMFSALTDTGAEATLDALAAGANDYCPKPSQSGNIRNALQMVKQELVPKVLKWGKVSLVQSGQKTALKSAPAPAARPTNRAKATPEILAVGASTGGPNALAVFLQGLPADFPLPIVIVQHMPARFTPLLAQRLTASTPFEVTHGDQPTTLAPGKVVLAAGDFHLKVARSGTSIVTQLSQDPPVNSCRPAVDVLFESVAAVYRDATLAIVLTGMGSDGMCGAGQVQKVGGQVIVQDQATSVVWGMPGSVATAGHANEVLPLTEIPPYVMSQLRCLARV